MTNENTKAPTTLYPTNRHNINETLESCEFNIVIQWNVTQKLSFVEFFGGYYNIFVNEFKKKTMM